MIMGVVRHPLTPAVVIASWADALLLWPLAWLVPLVAQGLGVVLVGGSWIGVSAPLGVQPWALVNEPGVGFAATRAALFGYWLAPFLGVAAVALVLTLLLSGGRSWHGEMGLFHLATAATVLGLGWLPALGLEDGPVDGLSTFWEVAPAVSVAAAAAVGAVLAALAAQRLLGHLWHHPTGPTRRRRLAAVVLHAVVPALAWAGATVAVGWPLPARAAAGAGAVVAGPLLAAFVLVPRAALRRRETPGRAGVAAALAVGGTVAVAVGWLGAPVHGHARGLLWGVPDGIDNIRPEVVRVEVRPRRVPPAPPAPSTPGS